MYGKLLEMAFPGKQHNHPVVEANVLLIYLFNLFNFLLMTLDLTVKAKIAKAELVL